MMKRTFGLTAIVAASLSAATAMANTIDFADDVSNALPGYRFRDQNVEMPNIADLLEIGSNVPNNGDNLDFLRITHSDSGNDAVNFIITLPRMRIVNDMGADGLGVDMYSLKFASGSTFAANGFVIYHSLDNGLLDPLLIADMTLNEALVMFGSSGQVEANPSVNLTNIRLITNGTLVGGNSYEGPDFQTLVDFKNDGLISADFVAGIFTAGLNLTQRVQSATTTVGSAAGSVQDMIPEPGTMLMLAVGAMMAVRTRMNRRRD